jgi:hypothetical protein
VGDSPNGLGTYQLQGGTLNSGSEVFGFSGPASMDHTGGVNIAGVLTIAAGSQAPTMYSVSGTAVLQVFDAFVGGFSAQDNGPGTLSVTNGGLVKVSGTLRTFASGTLVIGPTGAVDLQTNGQIVMRTKSAPDKDAKVASLAALITMGAANNWTGNGITSSANQSDATQTLGIFDNADLNLGNYNGETLTTDDVMVERTFLGDADLSKVVDAADFDIWYKHVGDFTFVTSRGDLDRSGIVDAADFDVWYKHVGLMATITAAPEPGSFATLGVAVAAMGRWRRR